MFSVRDWSIKTKLITLSVVAVGMALALAGAGVILNEIHTTRAMKISGASHPGGNARVQ